MLPLLSWHAQALKVMEDCVDHKKVHVPRGTHLYNVEVVEKRQGLHKRRGIKAVSSDGDPHTFLYRGEHCPPQ